MSPFKITLLIALATTTTLVYAQPKGRDEKAIGIFNVVSFPNDVCISGTNSRNGTCYTQEECTSRNGVASGSCADGFGVCCIITLTCGQTTRENCTYLTQTASNTPSTNTGSTGCSYVICPQTNTISRIRLDMETFQIAPPNVPGITTGAGMAVRTGGGVGACAQDTFTVTGSQGNVPVICGSNDNQHMIVDVDGVSCVTVAFNYGAATVQRSYTIHVLQYERGNDHIAGQEGCLQFFTGTTGTVRTFNWVDVAGSTHLQNQDYNICVRRRTDYCIICWVPTTAGTNATPTKGSFGLSNGGSTDNAASDAATPKGSLGGYGTANCAIGGAAIQGMDYIIIPQGNTQAIATLVTLPMIALEDRHCGRFLGPANQAALDAAVCSRATPFMLTVVTDNVEVDAAAAVAMQTMNEASIDVVNAAEPFGTMGFSLDFTQIGC